MPSSPSAHVTSSKMSSSALSRCSFAPKSLISRFEDPCLMSSIFCTFTSAPDFSMTSRTVSPPRPMTRPASRSLTQNFRGGWLSVSSGDAFGRGVSFRMAPSSPATFAYVTSSKMPARARSCACTVPCISTRPEALSSSILAPESLSMFLMVSPFRPRSRPTSSVSISIILGPGASASPGSTGRRVSFRTLPSFSRQKDASSMRISSAAFCSA
mmetsp:Transcript_56095/g.156283  ORF Transcript_56095/g.156283 Transcript_56095/m.156283 type:complete len:213 (-) Transcript_56095:908-1546(-)